MRDSIQVVVLSCFVALVQSQSCGSLKQGDGCVCFYGNDDDDGQLSCASGCCYNNVCRSSVNCNSWRIWGGILFFCCMFTTCFLFWYYVMRSQNKSIVRAREGASGGARTAPGAPPAYAAAVPVYAHASQGDSGGLRETLLQDDGVNMLNVQCPNPDCKLLLSFPTSACGGDVICGVCQARFPLLGVGTESFT
eukprot:m.179772 g.179772  ORF g.179772 m.179772 type:complete len:193 (+) comp18397_c0_seq1:87-665(+)